MTLPLKRVRINIDPNAPQTYYNETAADNSPEFAIVDRLGKQFNSWMKCKDFIHDTIWAFKTDTSSTLYGWQVDVTKPNPAADDRLILCLRWSPKRDVMVNCLANVKRSVESLESRLRIPKCQRTRFSAIRDNHHRPYFAIFVSPKWLLTSHHVSFFTFFLRASMLNESGKNEDVFSGNIKMARPHDSYYVKNGAAFINKLLSDGLHSVGRPWKEYKTNRHVHGDGFVAAARRMESKTENARLSAALAPTNREPGINNGPLQ